MVQHSILKNVKVSNIFVHELYDCEGKLYNLNYNLFSNYISFALHALSNS